MRTPLFQLDAFTTRRFAGDPAAVMPMSAFPSDAVMLAIAAENNLAETAFLVREGDGYRLRWFTPKVEVPLCGHATLASAAVVMERLEPARREVVFPEDPVTGAAHCMLAPYWAQRLGKTTLHAHQASARGGELTCRVMGERVELEGACVFYLEGEAEY